MVNMNLNVNFDNLTEEERNQLLALVEKSTKEPKVWKPKHNETYYYITSDGTISCTGFGNYNDDVDNNAYSIGNCYRTREDAQFAVEKLKVIAELKRFAQEHNDKINWDNNSKWKYYIVYNYKINNINCDAVVTVKGNNIYFKSEEIAKQAIETIGADRLKKYYFEVEE